MVLVLFGTELSPGVRAVLLTLRALELDHEFFPVDLFAGEHLEPYFVRKNPQRTVPVLQDNEACIWDSHAIMGYLVGKYAFTDALYPRDPLKRALVDQRLHFDSGILFVLFKQLQHLIFQEQVAELPKPLIEQVHKAYELLEQFLDGRNYMAGQLVTIADFSIAATLSTLHLSYAPVDAVGYPKLSEWLARISGLPYYEQANLRGARQMAELVRTKLPKQFDKLWLKAFEDIKSGAGRQPLK
ncbi:glutathione S-transferase 1 [Drosophila hydei]|uniref:Glutathione S-transferase 1 n=1 Tax=Drosophila hydei TaxID=7224 RepID=A0A6J1M2D6_DROHY|nr:glutathione S-transferase 1 [Drosophila hydei]